MLRCKIDTPSACCGVFDFWLGGLNHTMVAVIIIKKGFDSILRTVTEFCIRKEEESCGSTILIIYGV